MTAFTKKENTSGRPDHFLFVAYIIFFISIVFSLRAISSISIALILVTALIRNRFSNNAFKNEKSFLLFLIGCSLLFILQACALLYTKNLPEGLKLLQRSSALIFIPFAVLASRTFLIQKMARKLIFYFAIILSVASLYCLAVSSLHYFSGSPSAIFFYHDLVKPLSQHAIQFSILVFIALLFLIESYKAENSKSFNFSSKAMILFLSLFLILLSSKLIITFYIAYLLVFFLNAQFNRRRSLIFIASFIGITIAIMLTPNPIGNRFRAIFAGNSMLFTQKKFSPGVYFNGLQFRLLQWRFTGEILSEQHAWLTGLTPGDAQSCLDKKYVQTNMYTGIPGTEKHGFLGYHTHNQFLQVTLENGLAGLLIFLFICFSLIKMTSKRKAMKWFVVLLLTYCFTDAPLTTQYGLVIFTFFPAFIYFDTWKPIKQNLSFNQSFQLLKPDLPETASIEQPN